MSINYGAVDDVAAPSGLTQEGKSISAPGHRRLGSEPTMAFSSSRSSAPDVSLRGRAGGNIPLNNRHRVTTTTSLFGWKNINENSVSEEDDGNPKFVSLSDLIKDAEVPATLLYEPSPDDPDAVVDGRGVGRFPQQAMYGGMVGAEDALEAAEHGNSIHLSKFLQDGGDPETIYHLHHRRWSLLHLAAGCKTMGERPFSVSYRSRPEPDCADGYATCVSELLAAGADPNVMASGGGVTPLMCAAWTGSKECCALLLRAGADVKKKANDGWTAFDYAKNARDRGTSSGVLAVLRDPPKKVPRSPTMVTASLVTFSNLEAEDAVPPVELRWRVPSQASLAPTTCGDVERYYIKCWCRGKAKEVIMTKTSTVDVARRDFCRNQIIDRGIALRKNLCLPQSKTASTVLHGLQVGEIYSFTVSCVAEVEGALRHSPPSCMSKPLTIPDSKDDHGWDLGGIVSMVTGKDSPSPNAPADGGAVQPQAHRAPGQSPVIIDQRRGKGRRHSVSWAKDDSVSSIPVRQTASSFVGEGRSTSPTGRFGREWQSVGDPSNRSPLRRGSQQYSITRVDAFTRASSFGTANRQPPHSSPPLGLDTEVRLRAFPDTSTVSPVSRDARGRKVDVSRRSDRRFRMSDEDDSFQEEGCNVS